jgi:hypothetical protein
MRYLISLVVFIAAAAATVFAQARSANQPDRDEQLGAYLRTGRYEDARRLIDDILTTTPADDLRNIRTLFSGSPNMRVKRRPARFACEVKDDGVLLPLVVNGRHVTWAIDTGMDVSTISDAEAARLGLTFRGSDGRIDDLAGGHATARMAVARRVVIGRTELSDVSFLVLPADQMPFKELQPGRQGLLGLPIVIALEALRWKRPRTCSSGAAVDAESGKAKNLRYDHLKMIATVDFESKPLDFILDTGDAAGTQFWERFANDFDTLVKERGRKGIVRVTQIGGANDRETIVVPDVRLTVGRKETLLPQANVFSKPVGDSHYHGLLGMDVLSQATEVTIDFRSMTLVLR